MRSFIVKIVVFFMLINFNPIGASAQPTKFFVKANVSFPKAVSNKFFRQKYTGVYNLDLSVNYLVSKSIYVGLGGDYKMFQLRDNYVSTRKTYIENKKGYSVSSKALSGLVNIGYWKSDGASLVTDFNIGVGIMQTTNNTPIDTLKITTLTKAFTLQPKVGFYWYVDDDKLMMLGGTIGYTYVNSRFDADALKYNLISIDYTARDTKFSTQYINFGLGLIYRIGKSSGSNEFE